MQSPTLRPDTGLSPALRVDLNCIQRQRYYESGSVGLLVHLEKAQTLLGD